MAETATARIYTTAPGHVVYLDGYGYASNNSAALVPEGVAAEFAGRTDLRVEPIAQPSATPTKAAKRGDKE